MNQAERNQTENWELIRTLQSAVGPSRELDLDIALFLRWSPEGFGRDVLAGREDALDTENSQLSRQTADEWRIPHFTGSVDAALTLKPEGCEWSVTELSYPSSYPSRPFEAVITQHAFGYGAPSRRGDTRGKGHAATAALALCAAALAADQALRATQSGAE